MGNEEGRIKVCVVGPSRYGKTFLVQTYILGKPPQDQKPTLFEAYCKEISVERRGYRIFICDTGGIEDYSRLEKMAYLNTDIFILCVDYTARDALDKAAGWVSELRRSNTPVLLCLTKADGNKRLKSDEIQAFSRRHAVRGVCECSAFDKKSLRNLFETAVKMHVEGDVDGPTNYFGSMCC